MSFNSSTAVTLGSNGAPSNSPSKLAGLDEYIEEVERERQREGRIAKKRREREGKERANRQKCHVQVNEVSSSSGQGREQSKK